MDLRCPRRRRCRWRLTAWRCRATARSRYSSATPKVRSPPREHRYVTSSRARLPLPHPRLLTPLLRSVAAFCCARFRGRRRRWRRDATDEVWRMRRRRARVGRRGSRGRGWRRGARGWCARNDSSRWTGRSARSSCRGGKGAGESVRRGRSASSRAERRLETKSVSSVIFRRCCSPSRSSASGLVLGWSWSATHARARGLIRTGARMSAAESASAACASRSRGARDPSSGRSDGGASSRWGSRRPVRSTFARVSESILDVPSPRPLFELALKCVRRALVPLANLPRTANRGPRRGRARARPPPGP